ncbi:rotatin isoform X1 [Astyanax mexicanus]|uniref:rotatin isoform X1 n=1 Tax=Astyanax mexicanus TaxID=7994 RepID=UPI0020CADB6A|nr:rotatin isoform X1 [Astyanax mexicanus]
MDLSALIKKTAHSLVEIRVRALKNIRSKLDHGLISRPDLVQERTLFINLLEWFNFPEVPMQEEVLELLSTLSTHPTGAHMLRDVGAVEFLTQLSPSVEPSLQTIIDSIFDHLFHLPVSPSPSVICETQFLSSSEPVEETSVRGYFQQNKPSQTAATPPRVSVNTSVRCLKFSVFPWLALTPTDRHILSSNESSLRSESQDLVRTTCELLQDVIMQDFPAEIFLQRPRIVQNLLLLLNVSSESDSSSLPLRALACLQQLCRNLRSRLRFHRDPSFCSAKLDPVSQNSSIAYTQEARGTQRSGVTTPEDCSPRPSVVGRPGQRLRGDGQDGDAASTSSNSSQRGAPPGPAPQSPQPQPGLELPLEPEGEDSLELQVQQWNLAGFSVETLQHTLPLLRTGKLKVLQQVLELLVEVLALLGDSVAPELWDEFSLTATELREKLQACMETLGDIMSHHRSMTSSEQPESSVIHHRLAYIGTAIFTVRLLQTLLPVEKASENLPEGTVTALFHLSLDTPFSLAFPSIHESAVAYLEQSSSDSFSLYSRVSRAAHAMEATCSFLKEAQAEGNKNWLELLELADQAIDGLPYHQHLPVIKECVQICSYLWKSAQASPLLQMESQKIFLKLLSHPLLPVKVETYSCTLNVVKECLGVQNVAKPASSVCAGVHFLFHSRVLYEIGTFGLQDQAREVNSAAKDVLLYLLKGRLMMTASSWTRFNEALYPVIPVLQSYAGSTDALGNCILLISGVSGDQGDGVCSPAGRLRAALRLLFNKQHTVRSTAVEHLLPHLTSSESLKNCRPVLDKTALSSLPSLYVTNKCVDIKLDDASRSFLKVDSVTKLYNILASETVDMVLRRSAAEQLVVVLQDSAMHYVLKTQGLPDKLISFITESVNSLAANVDCLLEPTVGMLRKLVYADPSLRHSLAQQSDFLIHLLRVSLLIKANQGDVTEAAVLMCFLLFDEIARVDVWTGKADTDTAFSPFSLPVSIIRRYNLPFQSPSHHVVSPYCTVLPPYSDLLAMSAVREALQFSWNRAWHYGTEVLLKHLRTSRSHTPEFHVDLVLSEAQAVLLRVCDIKTGLQDCVEAVQTAGSHSEVTSVLTRMHLYLLTDWLALKPTTHSSKNMLQSLRWHPAMERFLQVRPACPQDEKLLVEIVSFLNTFLKQNQSDSDANDLRWLVELLIKQDAHTLLNLLLSDEAQGKTEASEDVGHQLQRELTGLFNTLLLRLTHTSDRTCRLLSGPLASELAVRLLQCLRLSDAPRFYGLPSLERALRSMAHTTALTGWSTHTPRTDPHTLCQKYLSGLLEVISSFYVEWGGNSMSFMGKGVTKNAVMCLLHLSHEMMAESKDKDWMSLWSLGQEQCADEPSAAQLGLSWLIPLWVDRDPEVRCASLAVGTALSSLESGCVALLASCQNISGGLWATLLNILLEKQECSMVRREAAFLLQNLLVMPMPANAEEAKDCVWQSPCVHDEGSGVSLVGLPALQALLYHCHFFDYVAETLQSCYSGRYAFALSPPPTHSEPEVNDSLRHLRVPKTQHLNHTQSSGSVSTSSTLLLPGGSSETHSPVLSSTGAAQDTPFNRLTAQGQSDAESSDSSLSQDSPETSACVAVVTPHLLSAICSLLANLVTVLPEFTLTALRQKHILQDVVSAVDVAELERCLGELKNPDLLPVYVEEARNQVLGGVCYVRSVCKLLQCTAVHSEEVFSQAEFLTPLLNTLISALTLPLTHTDVCTQDALLHTWADVLMLLAILLLRSPAAVGPSACAALGRRWKGFSDTVQVCVGLWGSEPSLYTSCLHFLCVLFSQEAKKRGQNPESSRNALSAALHGEPAEQLCEMLLERYEKTQFQDPLKKIIAKALMALLACSPSAQSYACKAGFIDSCVEHMKQIYSQLQLESLKPSKSTLRKKEENSLKELRMVLEVLRNCLYQNNECKDTATDLRLAAALLALWPWLLLYDPLMIAVLELLCVYTANCNTACRAVCGSGCISGHASLPRVAVTNSLMHGVMKLAAQVPPDNSNIHSLSFSLLTNLSISRDSRGLLQKSNFLQHFLSVPIPRQVSKGSGSAVVTLSQWLQLLLSISFGEDGQVMIVKLRGAVELLVDLAKSMLGESPPTALLILHNICFCSANKARVLACDKAVGLLWSCLDNSSAEIRAIGASALWALLHNFQKAKTTLKSPSIRLKVDEAHARAKKVAEQKNPDRVNVYLLKCLENLSKILNT